MSMTAYAPYTGERGTLPGVVKATTSSEMQTAAAQSAIDFLYAEGGAHNVRHASISGSFTECPDWCCHSKPKVAWKLAT